MKYIVVFKRDSGVLVCSEPDFERAPMVASFVTAIRSFMEETLGERVENVKMGNYWLLLKDAGELTVALVSEVKDEYLIDILANKLRKEFPRVPDIVTPEISKRAKNVVLSVLEETPPYAATEELFKLLNRLPPVCPYARKFVEREKRRAEKDSERYSSYALRVLRTNINKKYAYECIELLAKRDLPSAFKAAIKSGSAVLAAHMLITLGIVKGFVPRNFEVLLNTIKDDRKKTFLEQRYLYYFSGIETKYNSSLMKKSLSDLVPEINLDSINGIECAALFLPINIFSEPPSPLEPFITDFEKEISKAYRRLYESFSDVFATWGEYSERLSEFLIQMFSMAEDFSKTAETYPEKSLAVIVSGQACEVYSTILTTSTPPEDVVKLWSERIITLARRIKGYMGKVAGKGASVLPFLNFYNALLFASTFLNAKLHLDDFARYAVRGIPLLIHSNPITIVLTRICIISAILSQFGVKGKYFDTMASLYPPVTFEHIRRLYGNPEDTETGLFISFWLAESAHVLSREIPTELARELEKVKNIFLEEVKTRGASPTIFDMLLKALTSHSK